MKDKEKQKTILILVVKRMASFLVNVPLTQPIDIDSNNGKFLLESLPKAEIPPEVSELFETLRGEALRRALPMVEMEVFIHSTLGHLVNPRI